MVRGSDEREDGSAGLRDADVPIFQLSGNTPSWIWSLHQELCGGNAVVDRLADFASGNGQYVRPRSLSYGPSLREYFRQRHDLSDLREPALRPFRLGMERFSREGNPDGRFPGIGTAGFHRIAPARRIRAGVYFHGAAVGLFGIGDGGRTLIGFVPTRSGNMSLQCEPGCTVSGNHLLAAIYKEAVHEEV